MFYPERVKNIKPNDKVLEIGPGSSPFPKSDVYLEKYFNDEESYEQRGLQNSIEYKKQIHYYKGVKFPFRDKEFDYVICSHVLEHIPPKDIKLIIKEIERVANRGYIEVPSLFYEFLFNFHVHKWLINYKNNKMYLLDKSNIIFSQIQDVFYLMLKYGGKKRKITLINDFIELFIIGFEWDHKIDYKIVNSINDIISDDDVVFYKEYFKNLNQKPEGDIIKIGLKKIITLFRG